MTSGKIWTVVVNYRSERKLLEQCLQSVQSNKVIVIDNSQDNRGFAKAVNWGIKEAIRQGAEAVFLLNPDARIIQGNLSDLLKEKAEIVGAVIEDKSGWDYGGAVDWWWGKTKHVNRESLSANRQINYVSGCAMLIKKAVWEKIGFLDERFFLYYEDVDYCLRAQKAGFKIGLCPQVKVFHQLKKVEERPWRQNWQLIKSHWRFLRKYRFNLLAYFHWLVLAGKILLK
jgi:GT2 family glycosyltransferase